MTGIGSVNGPFQGADSGRSWWAILMKIRYLEGNSRNRAACFELPRGGKRCEICFRPLNRWSESNYISATADSFP
jgi:hypothetical protein